MAARYKKGSTQEFTEIVDIQEDIVLMRGGNACLLVELQSTNFALLSGEEQDAKVFGYAGLLNSLSFPIQIMIESKQVDIVPYISSLGEAAKVASNPKLAQNITQYKEFVEKLVTSNLVLDKRFFIVISYSLLEEGVSAITKFSGKDTKDFFIKASAGLHTKAESLLSQIDRMAIKAKVVEREGLLRLFQDRKSVV